MRGVHTKRISGSPMMGARPAALLTPLLCALALAGCGSLVPTNDPANPPLRADFRTPVTVPIEDLTIGVAGPAGAASAAGASGEVTTDAAASEAAKDWESFFADPRLARVVGAALTQNRSLRASVAAVERVRAQYRIAEVDRLPEISAGASVTRQRTINGEGATTAYGVNLGLASWEIDLFGRLRSLEGAALARFLAEQETQRGTRLSLVAEVTQAWLTLAAEQQRLLLARELATSQQLSGGLVERQYKLGAVSGLEVARARTAYESARGDAARSVSAVKQARLQLELLAGQPLPDDWLPTAQDGRMFTALPAIPAGLPADVLLQRPDLRAAEQRLQAAAYDVGAARAARFPRITLTASGGTRSAELDGLFRGGSQVWSVVPQIDLPLFDGGARRAQVEVNEATRREAMANYESALQSAFREVGDALAVRDSLSERLEAQQEQVKAARRTLDLAEAGYRLGSISQLDLLDAQRQMATAEQALVTLRLTEQGNRVELMRALGGRWNGERVAP